MSVLDVVSAPFAVLAEIGSSFRRPVVLTAYLQAITIGTAFVCVLYSLQLRHTGHRVLTGIMRACFVIIGTLSFWFFLKRLDAPHASIPVEVLIYRTAFFLGITAASLRRF